MTDTTPRVHFVYTIGNRRVEALFDRLIAELRRLGISADWQRNLSTPVPDDGVVITHSALADIPEDLDICLLGQRTLNRQQRLVLAGAIGAPVARWIAPTNTEELRAFCSTLQTESVVFKQDKSFRKWGVWLHRVSDPWPAELHEDTDVFMEVLTHDPYTYKVEVFYDTVVGGRIFPTSSILSSTFYDKITKLEPFDPPPDVARISTAIGREFLRAGCGYLSIDWMRTPDRFVIIEVNTCDVGLGNSWTFWPHFVERYAAAVTTFLTSGSPRPSLRQSYAFARSVSRHQKLEVPSVPRRMAGEPLNSGR